MKFAGKRNVQIFLAVCMVAVAAVVLWQFVQRKPIQAKAAQEVTSDSIAQIATSGERSPQSLPQSTPDSESAVSASQGSDSQPAPEEDEIYPMYMQAEYLFTSITDLYRESDLVIYAEYLHDNKSFMNEGELISTMGEARVLQVLKGNCEEEIVSLLFTGGTVSSAEYLNAIDEDIKQNRGIKEADFLETYQAVTLESDEMAKLESGKFYLLFLSYVEDYQSYAVNAGCYGAREVSQDGKIYSPEQGAFITDDTGLFSVQKNGEKLQFLSPKE